MTKLFTTLLLTFSISFAFSQGEIDSAWVAKTYFPKFSQDTGSYLSNAKFIDEKGNTRYLSEFKGKILLIDIWTTWCVNCIDRFPHSEQLYKRLKAIHLDTAIQFINICTEDSKAEWKKRLKEHHPIGINLYSKDTAIYKTWKIEVFPRYILLDKTGKVLCMNFCDPSGSDIDYTLYAASKGIKPAESVWTAFREYQHYRKYGKYTDDAEGIDYANWYNSIAELLREYSQWRYERFKKSH